MAKFAPGQYLWNIDRALPTEMRKKALEQAR
jgi:hypothetical protein